MISTCIQVCHSSIMKMLKTHWHWTCPEAKVPYKNTWFIFFRIAIIEKDNDKLQQQLQDLRSKRQRREELEREVAEPPKRELKKDRRLIPGIVYHTELRNFNLFHILMFEEYFVFRLSHLYSFCRIIIGGSYRSQFIVQKFGYLRQTVERFEHQF